MKLLVLRIFLWVSIIKCIASGEIKEEGETLPEKSRFKKFLNLFGIGTMKQFQPGESIPDFSPYGYPCPMYTTTTTTPAPVMLSPLLCPYPPMMPGQMQQHSANDGHDHNMPSKSFPRPVAFDQLPPPPTGGFPLPPPHDGGQRPQTNMHGGFPRPPFSLPPGFKPLPGQHIIFPAQSHPPFPSQNIPQPIQPNQSRPNDPSFMPQNPSNPLEPVLVDPANPENPVKVNPTFNNPFDPIKVNPTIFDPTKPIQVNPVNQYPSQPLLVGPTQSSGPFLVDPSNSTPERPFLVDPMTPTDPKEFSKHQPLSPHGPMNVLINPGLPDFPIFPGKLPVPVGQLQPPPVNGNIPLGPPVILNNESRPNFNSTPASHEPTEPLRPNCASPFLKPYIPNGFHFSSVKQLIGLPPLPNHRLFPCPTLDLLTVLEFKTMRSLIVSSGLTPLVKHTSNYTIFLPSDAAFRRLPRWFRESLDADPKLKKALVLNHLVKEDLPLSNLKNEELVLSARPGGNRLRVNIYQPENSYRTITIDGAEVEIGDILSSNGRVHIVNKVLMPNLPRNAAQFLSEKLEFESFWNHVKQADLVSNFQDARPFTLFIPINEAVKKLNDSAFLNDKDKLRNFVNYHMVNGSYYSGGLVNQEFLLTNYEKEIKMQVNSDTFSKSLTGINGKVKVLKADITLTNGVAHVIDQCISEETPFYVYPQSDEFKNEYGVMRRSFKITGEEKNIENAF